MMKGGGALRVPALDNDSKWPYGAIGMAAAAVCSLRTPLLATLDDYIP